MTGDLSSAHDPNREVPPMDRTDEDRAFCEHCGVTMDLHPSDSGDDWECNVAQQKADTMARFFGIFAR